MPVRRKKVAGNTKCSSRYIGIIKFHSRPGANGSVSGVLNSSNYLVSHSSIEELKEEVDQFLCRNGYNAGSIPFKVYLIDQEESKVVAHLGVDPKPFAEPWVDAAKS